MKILVTYYSKTGNTKAVAEAIFDALVQEDKVLMNIKEAGNPQDYALIFCGFPVHAHSVPVPAQNFIQTLPSGVKLALFSTHGSQREGQMPKEAVENAVGLARNAEVLGSFTCRGKVEEDVLEELMQKPEHKAWAMEAQSAEGHPDKADLEDARMFARSMLKQALKFSDFTKK